MLRSCACFGHGHPSSPNLVYFISVQHPFILFHPKACSPPLLAALKNMPCILNPSCLTFSEPLVKPKPSVRGDLSLHLTGALLKVLKS